MAGQASLTERAPSACSPASCSCAPVAQLDRASASGAEGHRFESCRAHHKSPCELARSSRSGHFCARSTVPSATRIYHEITSIATRKLALVYGWVLPVIPSPSLTIRRERNGWRAYTRVSGRLQAKRFPADTPRAEIEGWISALHTRPPQLPEAERVALEFWEAYRPGWVIGLLKTEHGWKVQVSVKGGLAQKRFRRTTSLVQMLTWRDAQRIS